MVRKLRGIEGAQTWDTFCAVCLQNFEEEGRSRRHFQSEEHKRQTESFFQRQEAQMRDFWTAFKQPPLIRRLCIKLSTAKEVLEVHSAGVISQSVDVSHAGEKGGLLVPRKVMPDRWFCDYCEIEVLNDDPEQIDGFATASS